MLCRTRMLLACLGALAVLTGSANGQEDYLSANLIPNGDLETDVDADGYPAGWPRSKSTVSRQSTTVHPDGPVCSPTPERPPPQPTAPCLASCSRRAGS